MPARRSGPPADAGRNAGSILARNTLLNLGGFGLPLVVGVFAMPVVVEGLGPERFGILALVWVVLGYMALLDMGLGRATTKFAAEALADGDSDRIASSARIAASCQLVVGVASGVGLALAVPLLVERFLDVPPALEPEARSSFYRLALITPLLLITNTFRGLLEAAQRFDLVNAVRLPVSTANFLIPLAGVLLGWSLPIIVAVLMAMRAAALAAYLGFTLREYPGVLTRTRARGEDVRELLGFGGWVTVSSLISPLLVYLDRFIVGGAVSLAAVGYYSAPHEIVMRLTVLPASIVATVFPALSAGARLGERQRIGRLVARSLKFLLVSAGPVLVALAALAPDILGLWLGAVYAVESGLALRFLAAGMLINALAYIPNVLLQAAGRPDLPAKFHMAELPVHLAVLWAFVAAWGISGAAAAWALRVAVDCALLFVASARLGLISWAEIRLARIPATLAFLVVLTGLLALVTTWIPVLIPRLLAGGIVLLMAAAAIWSAVLDSAERERLMLAFRRHG